MGQGAIFAGGSRWYATIFLGLVFCAVAPRASGACAGDINGDNVVDGADLGLLLGAWGTANPASDLNNSGNVDGADLGLLLGAWGPCPIVLAILEPPTMHMPPAAPFDSSEMPDWTDDPYGKLGINGSQSMVYDFSGEAVVHAVDLRVRGRGMDFVFARKYRSRQQTLSPMGASNQWDYSYNISIEQSGPDIVVHDGNTRADVYIFDPGTSTWSADGFFRTIEQDFSGDFVCTFAKRGIWRFNGFTGSPIDGRIQSITDRNGNTMQFEYNPLGQLEIVRDTLYSVSNPREYGLSYDPSGFLQSVTDYTGRQVLYQYYDGIEPGGNFGDLKSVTSPAVVGTTTGNDFPMGKTTTYTYSTGFADPLLNGNLLSINDAKAQTFTTFSYGSINPIDVSFDRVTQQTLGGALDLIDRVYVAQSPGDEHPLSVLKVIVNDRAGNVSESLYDAGNRLVEFREFTGRAPNPDFATGQTTNRPTGQVRASDPAVYVTQYEYNADSLCTRMILPRGNSIEKIYDSVNPDHRSRGNMLDMTHFVGGIVADQIQISAQLAYDPVFNFDTNMTYEHTDGKGNTTTYLYNTNGNVLQIVHRLPSVVEDFSYNSFGQMTQHIYPANGTALRKIDSFTYYGALDGPLEGYRKETIRDSAGFALTTTYEYDLLGRMVRSIDPRGNDTLTEFNQLDQVVRVDSRPLSLPAGPAIRYDITSMYDANDNLVRVDVRDLDENGNVRPTDVLTTMYEYDILDYRTIEIQEVGDFTVPTVPLQLDVAGLPDSEFLRTEYTYDDNRNMRDKIFGEAAEGRDPGNTVRYVYDERDLVFQEVCGPFSAVPSTTQFDYDANRNVVRTAQGLEDIAVGGAAYETTKQYDGYDRLTFVTDAMGNTAELHYDANNNVVSTLAQGELDDILGSVLNVPLFDVSYLYDALDRVIRSTIVHFDSVTQTPIGDGLSTTDFVWTDASNLLSRTDDNSHTMSFVYDTAYRLSTATDAAGNTQTQTYDANSNVVQTSSTEKSDTLAPDQTFVFTFTYDALDRRVSSSDGVGNLRAYAYDSRSNPGIAIDPDGNPTVYVYDGLNRRVRTIHTLTDDGTGAGTVTGTIELPMVWDDSHRVVTRTDGEGNSTQYAYDSLNRMIRETHADSTQELYTYDPHDNIVQETDPSGTTNTMTYDLRGRRRDLLSVAGPGVSSETTFVTFGYDGLDRLVSAVDDDSNTTFEYDSLSNNTRESRGGIILTVEHDGVGNITRKDYPNGIIVDYSYNNIDLLNSIDVNDTVTFLPLIQTQHVGTRYESHTLGNGVSIDFAFDGVSGVPNAVGDFGFRRPSGVSHTGVGSLLDFTYRYDARQNKKEHSILFGAATSIDTALTYDSMSRLRLSSTTVVGAVFQVSIRLVDRAGNRLSESGTSSSGLFTLDATSPPADLPMNQYTTTPRTSETHTERGERAARDTVIGPATQTYVYNYDDKLVQHTDALTGDTVVNRYDALGRRIGQEVITSLGTETTEFVLDGVQVIEERDAAGSVLRTMFYGAGVDEYIAFTPGIDLTNIHYMHRDNQDSVHVVTDSLANPAEVWRYSDFGEPRRSLYSQLPDQFGAAASDTAALGGFNPQKYAENFVMPENARVTTLEWGGGYAFSTPGLIPSDDFTVRFYADAAGSPGPLIHVEQFGVVGRTKTGNIMTINSVEEYVYTSRVELPPTLQAGLTYWISIENNLLGTGNVWGWETSASGDGVSALSVAGGAYAADTLNFSLHVFTDESAIGNPYLFHGRRYEPEMRLYYFRSRFMDPQTGRFITRDPAGMWSDPAALGNGYTFAGNNPYTLSDPFGQAAYIKYDGVDGESEARDKDHEGWIEVLSYGTGVHSPTGGATSGRRRGGVTLGDVVVVQEYEKSTPKIAEVCCNGANLKNSKIQLVTGGGTTIKYDPIELERPMESLSLNFAKVDVRYTEQKGTKSKGNTDYFWKMNQNDYVITTPLVKPLVLVDRERCEGADDDCDGDDGVVSPSIKSYDYGDLDFKEAKAFITPYGANGLPVPNWDCLKIYLDPNYEFEEPRAHVTPYGADGKPVLRRFFGITIEDEDDPFSNRGDEEEWE